MTTIRTTCPRCGEVDMGPQAILLSVLHGGREGSYRFTCPSCQDDVEKRADRKVIALLVSAGVDIARSDTLERTRVDEREPDPRGSLPEGPAFMLDDLIDFHFLLQDDRAIEDFLSAQR